MKSICSIAWLVLLLEPAAAARAPIKKTLTGHIDPSQVFSFVYVPFEVEVGTTSIYVLQNYSNKGQGNALDLGIFDQRGYQMMDAQNGATGSRGWSGGFRCVFLSPSYCFVSDKVETTSPSRPPGPLPATTPALSNQAPGTSSWAHTLPSPTVSTGSSTSNCPSTPSTRGSPPTTPPPT